MSYAIIYEYAANGEAIIHAITNANSIINEARYAYPNSYVILYEWSKISLNTDNSYLISEVPEDYFSIDEPDDFSDCVVFFYYDRWDCAVITDMGAYDKNMRDCIMSEHPNWWARYVRLNSFYERSYGLFGLPFK